MSVGEELAKDRNFLLKATRRSSAASRYIPEELKGDRDFMLDAVRFNARALEDCAPSLKADRDFLKDCFRENGRALRFSPNARADKELLLAAVAQSGLVLRLAERRLRSDREVVLVAVRNNGLALQFANKALRDDYDLVMAATKSQGAAFRFASEAFRGRRENALAAARANAWALRSMPRILSGDVGVITEALTQSWRAFYAAPEFVRRTRAALLIVAEQWRAEGAVEGTFGCGVATRLKVLRPSGSTLLELDDSDEPLYALELERWIKNLYPDLRHAEIQFLAEKTLRPHEVLLLGRADSTAVLKAGRLASCELSVVALARERFAAEV